MRVSADNLKGEFVSCHEAGQPQNNVLSSIWEACDHFVPNPTTVYTLRTSCSTHTHTHTHTLLTCLSFVEPDLKKFVLGIVIQLK